MERRRQLRIDQRFWPGPGIKERMSTLYPKENCQNKPCAPGLRSVRAVFRGYSGAILIVVFVRQKPLYYTAVLYDCITEVTTESFFTAVAAAELNNSNCGLVHSWH